MTTLIAGCGPVDGPSALLEEQLHPRMGEIQVVQILGKPSAERTLEEWQPPIRELRYPQWGITAEFGSGGTLRRLFVSRPWTTPIHGVTVGDEIARLRRTVRMVKAPGYEGLQLEDHPSWLVFLDETGERVRTIQLTNLDAPLYYSIPR